MTGQPVEVGTTLPTLTARITRETLVRYAGASGDLNPIHYSDHAAAALGLPGVIAQGMLTMGTA
ncbi:MAG: MaoC/PaaZ C-terminal domain-containing protein, partial [Janthinobacterium lividum]